MELLQNTGQEGFDHLLPKDSIESSSQPTPNTANTESVFVQLTNAEGEETGSPIWLPLAIDTSKLTDLLNELLTKQDNETSVYDFFIGNVQLLDTLKLALVQARAKGSLPVSSSSDPGELESVVKVTYYAQAVFRVRPVTRCTSTLPGHKGAILVAQFSPDARTLATGSGDHSVRFWDLKTELPAVGQTDNAVNPQHGGPILCLAWSPDGLRLASACQSGVVLIWSAPDDQSSWAPSSKPLVRSSTSSNSNARSRWIRSLAWRPFHLDSDCRRLIVAYQDCSMIVWDTWTGQQLLSFTGHDQPVVCVRWGGSDLIYSASHDRSIRVWRSQDGALCRTLSLHGHWVNCLALSTDYVLRTGPFDPAKADDGRVRKPPAKDDKQTREAMCEEAKKLYQAVKGSGPERLVSGSDDNTLSLWQPEIDKKPIAARMTGHQGVVNDVRFSPDSRLLASASFDHSVKLWDGLTGQFLATLFGHVQEVYLLAWSSDSRLLVSCSRDSTVKLWSLTDVRRWNQEAAAEPNASKKRRLIASDIKSTSKQQQPTNKAAFQRRRHLLHDLPGHSDAVYALDWSPDGQRVASGGKDRVLKLWRT